MPTGRREIETESGLQKAIIRVERPQIVLYYSYAEPTMYNLIHCASRSKVDINAPRPKGLDRST